MPARSGVQNVGVESPRRLVSRHRGKMAVFFIATLGATLALNAYSPPAYESQGMIYLRPAGGAEASEASPLARQAELNSAAEILGSPAFSQAVLADIPANTLLARSANPLTDLARGWLEEADAKWGPWWENVRPVQPQTSEQQALAALSEGLAVRSSGESNVIHITFEGPTAEVAQQVVDKLIDLYAARHVKLHTADVSLERLSQQTAEVEKQLHQKQAALRDLKNRTQVAAVDLRRETLMARVGRLEDRLLETELAIFTARATEKSLQDQLASLPDKVEQSRTSGLPNQGLDLMRSQLYALQLKEQELLSIYREDAPQVKDIRRQIGEARKLLGDEAPKVAQVSVALSTTRQSVQRDLLSAQSEAAALEQQLKKLQSQLAATQADLKQLNTHELAHSELERETSVLQTSAERYAQSLHQARIDEALRLQQSSNVALVQAGTFNPTPVWPNKPWNLAVGLLVAVLGSWGLARAVDYLKQPAPHDPDVDFVPISPRQTTVSTTRPAPERQSSEADLAGIH